MLIKQISIFIENKKGRLSEITKVLADNKLDIRALSIADTTDYGILRLIVSDPDKAMNILKESEMTATITNVMAIGITDKPGGFYAVVKVLNDANINVEYAYAFITPKAGAAYVIIRVEDNEKAAEVLKIEGIQLLSQEEIF